MTKASLQRLIELERKKALGDWYHPHEVELNQLRAEFEAWEPERELPAPERQAKGGTMRQTAKARWPGLTDAKFDIAVQAVSARLDKEMPRTRSEMERLLERELTDQYGPPEEEP